MLADGVGVQLGLAGHGNKLVGARVAETLVDDRRAGRADAKHMVVRHAGLRDKLQRIRRSAEHIMGIHRLAGGEADLLYGRHVGGRLKHSKEVHLRVIVVLGEALVHIFDLKLTAVGIVLIILRHMLTVLTAIEVGGRLR